MNEVVTSVARREQKLGDAASAISVLSNDDLRRSGVTTIADALRLVPGMDVAAINSSQWAISSRGFNSVYATKLLVLIDGRAVYNPMFGGVYWDQQQTMLEDVDRIEVIRGPGATVWGANAVNGVINVVTRSARETQGGLIYAGGGDVERVFSGVRYGGRWGDHTYYRVFASHQERANFSTINGASAHDAWQMSQGGFRLDQFRGEDTHLTWQADASRSRLEDGVSDARNLDTLGRWTSRGADGSQVEVQAYYDSTDSNQAARARNRANTFDFTAQHRFEMGERQDVIWGVGYRFISAELTQTNPALPVRDGTFDRYLFSAFVQEEFKAKPDLTFTTGVKLEHNDYTGFEVQPSVRVLFKPAAEQTVWAAISRAARTPDGIEGRDTAAPVIGAPVVGPDGGYYLPSAVGNPNVRAESLTAYEIGYRIQATNRVHADVALFYNEYRNLISTIDQPDRWVPGVPVGILEFKWANRYDAQTYGAEASVTFSPTDAWRLIATTTLFDQKIYGPKTADGIIGITMSPPKFQAGLRSSWNWSRRSSLDVQLRYVGEIDFVPAYFTGDLQFSYRIDEQLELSIGGRNLFDPKHLEQVPIAFAMPAQIPRSIYGKVTWRF